MSNTFIIILFYFNDLPAIMQIFGSKLRLFVRHLVSAVRVSCTNWLPDRLSKYYTELRSNSGSVLLFLGLPSSISYSRLHIVLFRSSFKPKRLASISRQPNSFTPSYRKGMPLTPMASPFSATPTYACVTKCHPP